MATNVLHDLKRLSSVDIDQLPDRLSGDLVPVFIDEIAGMYQELRLGEFQLAGLPKVLTDLGFQLRVLPPGFHRLAIESKRSDARTDIVLITILRHQGELAGDDSHDRLLRDRVTVIGYTSAGGVVFSLEYVLAQLIPCDVQESRLGSGEETLPDATADIEIVVVRYLFLVI